MEVKMLLFECAKFVSIKNLTMLLVCQTRNTLRFIRINNAKLKKLYERTKKMSNIEIVISEYCGLVMRIIITLSTSGEYISSVTLPILVKEVYNDKKIRPSIETVSQVWITHYHDFCRRHKMENNHNSVLFQYGMAYQVQKVILKITSSDAIIQEFNENLKNARKKLEEFYVEFHD